MYYFLFLFFSLNVPHTTVNCYVPQFNFNKGKGEKNGQGILLGEVRGTKRMWKQSLPEAGDKP